MTTPKKGGPVATPAPPEPPPSRMTVGEIEKLAAIFEKLLKDTHLKFWVVCAGLGGIVELLRLAGSLLAWGIDAYIKLGPPK